MAKAFFIDTTVCTGCRGCQVACKQWKGLPGDKTVNRGSFQNPEDLSFTTFKLVRMSEVEIDKTLQTSVPSALVSLRKLTTRYPGSPQAEEAWWRLADLYQGINRQVHAAEACASLASSFPRTRYDAWWRAGDIYE